MRARALLALLTAWPVLFACPPAQAQGAKSLELADVIASIEQHHPLILSERMAVAAAQGELLAARGEFDTTLQVQGRAAPAGYYDPKRVDVVIEQPTPVLGASLYAGYRLTRGNVAPYYGEQRTLDAGEVRSGVKLPLLQDRAIDARRAGTQAARAQLSASEQGYRKVRLDLEREAAQAYFTWVAAGQRLRIVTNLVGLAEFRDSQIRQKVELGALPSIELLDNQRNILERKRQLVTTRRSLEKGAIDLSLYLRTTEGKPVVPDDSRLPAEIERSDDLVTNVAEAQRKALDARPELLQLEAQVSAARIDRTLADNRVVPRLDSFVEVSKDLGGGQDDVAYTLAPTVVEVGVTFSMPLWLRRARGKLQAAEAKLSAIEQKASFAEDKVRADVLDAWSQLRAARERVDMAFEAASIAEQVAVGERERFELGATTVLFVNLREQAAADAQIALTDALADAGIALLRCRLAMGERLSAP